MARVPAAALGALLAIAAVPATAQSGCVMAESDRSWLERGLALWERAAEDELGLSPAPLPTVQAIDASCSYILAEGDLARLTVQPHGGAPILPEGNEIPLGPISFAMGQNFFVMSLPSVWREAGVSSEMGLEPLMTGVLLHEIMHTAQSDLATGALAGPAAAAGIADADLTDDVVQELFGGEPDYEAAFREELAVLFAAAAAPDEAGARGLAAHALHLMRSRRASWFSGERSGLAELEDIFLTMEGMGQWLIYRHFLSADGGADSADAALAAVRRGGRWWSQDEGLALILVVDRLLPNWQERAFRDPDWRASLLLEAAIAHRPSE